MRAAYYERTGPADQVLLLGELREPVPGPGEVRIRLHWSGCNRHRGYATELGRLDG